MLLLIDAVLSEFVRELSSCVQQMLLNQFEPWKHISKVCHKIVPPKCKSCSQSFKFHNPNPKT